MISSTISPLSFRTWLAAARSALCRYPGRSPPRLGPPMARKVAFFMGENEQNPWELMVFPFGIDGFSLMF